MVDWGTTAVFWWHVLVSQPTPQITQNPALGFRRLHCPRTENYSLKATKSTDFSTLSSNSTQEATQTLIHLPPKIRSHAHNARRRLPLLLLLHRQRLQYPPLGRTGHKWLPRRQPERPRGISTERRQEFAACAGRRGGDVVAAVDAGGACALRCCLLFLAGRQGGCECRSFERWDGCRFGVDFGVNCIYIV